MDNKNLNEEKKLILQQFRKNMSDLLQPCHDDRFLLRWLRARNFNLQQAEKMLREDFKERKKLKSDSILTDYKIPEVIMPHFSSAFLGFSKMGHFVRLADIGAMDGKGLVKSVTVQDALLSFLYMFEWDNRKLEKHNKKTGNDVETNVYIFDYSKLHLYQWCDRSVFRACTFLVQKYQDHYPERLHAMYGINASSFIVYMFNIILKPFLAENIVEKVHIYSAGDDSYKEPLFSLVPKEIIPAYLGGERYEPEGDPTCSGRIIRGPKIPSSYYLKNQMTLKLDDPNVQHKIVRERSILEIEQEITVIGTILCWQFQTKEHNIKFGLFFKNPQRNCEKKVEPEELMPVENFESDIIVERGEYVCEKEGIYILHFDNKYSWMRSKHLFYKVEAQKPDI